ncbi:MAG: 4-hydroxythreonine-4-phosphate dehydrogenase PdxA [Betaproteobacteria bacterium]
MNHSSAELIPASAKPIAITLGDAAGIGPEIIAKAFVSEPALLRNCFVAGDVATMRRALSLVSSADAVPWPVAHITHPEQACALPPRCLAVLQVGAPLQPVVVGRVSALAGEFAGRCVAWAANSALRGEVAAVVTAPLHKEALGAAGAPYNRYPGHTEMLQDIAATYLGLPTSALPVRMMLANGELRTVLVSIHLSLRRAIEAVDFERVLQTIVMTHNALRGPLGRAPRIAVAGLNPHAGEGGLFGDEEHNIIAPAVAAARAQGCDASGPWAPDTVFMRARAKARALGEFDAVVAMYHDQGLIPVKYLGVENGVNITLGLPFIRTSPDHGTAFDIAGLGCADASSLLSAIRMARLWVV